MEALPIEDQITYAWTSRRRDKGQHSREHIHLARYVRPELAEFFEERKTTDRPAIEMLWDDTAIKANDMFARGLWSLGHNSATTWFEYEDEDPAMQRDSEVLAWYDMVNRDLFTQLGSSGVYEALLLRLADVGAFGFGALYSYEPAGEVGKINYEWVPASECFYTVGRNGLANSFIRPLNLTARQAVIERGWSIDKLDPTVKTAYENKDETTKFLFLHVVWERKDRPYGRRPMNSKEFPWAGYYFEMAGRKVIDEHGFRDFPYHVLGWGTASNRPYPVGIGYRTLPEIRNINAQRKKFDRILDNESDSPILATSQDEGKEQFRPRPGEYLYNGMSGEGRRLYDPLYQNNNGSRTLSAEIETSRVIIQEAWYYALFMMQTQHQMTAQEVRSRDAKLIQAMGPFMVLMASDLRTIVERMFYTRLEAGIYEPMPAAFTAETSMKLNFRGILAKAQETIEGEQIVSLAAEAQLIAQFDPDAVLHGTDWNAAYRHLAKSKSIPKDIVFSEERYRQNLKEAKQQQQAQQAAAMAPGLAKAAKDGAGAMKDMADAERNSQMA